MKKVIDDLDLKFFQCSSKDILPLRHQVLTPEQYPSSAIFGKDFLTSSLHFVGRTPRAPKALVCCASYFLVEWEGFIAYQVSGLAVAKEFQKQGAGRKILRFAEDLIKTKEGITKFWCEAPVGAIGFFESQGWTCSGPEFRSPEGGLHRKMTKGIAPF